jgi:hypothetical protein
VFYVRSVLTLSLEIVQPALQMHDHMVLLVAHGPGGRVYCWVRDGMLHGMVLPKSPKGELLLQGVQALAELMIAWLRLD